ncbi:hypothetical protein AX16_010963, partial [Volvariella volvacea WC 439]
KLCKQEWMTENPSKRIKDFEAHWAGLTPKVCKQRHNLEGMRQDGMLAFISPYAYTHVALQSAT